MRLRKELGRRWGSTIDVDSGPPGLHSTTLLISRLILYIDRESFSLSNGVKIISLAPFSRLLRRFEDKFRKTGFRLTCSVQRLGNSSHLFTYLIRKVGSMDLKGQMSRAEEQDDQVKQA